jgi:hypothetical protein
MTKLYTQDRPILSAAMIKLCTRGNEKQHHKLPTPQASIPINQELRTFSRLDAAMTKLGKQG